MAGLTESNDPLAGLRILEITNGDGDLIGRMWSDLGADVLKIEVPGGRGSDERGPHADDVNLRYALHNANKRRVVLDPASPTARQRFLELAADADIVVASGNPGSIAEFDTSCAELADHHSHLVTMSVTDFGTTGPLATWTATDAVLYAMSAALSQSRNADGVPVLPPDGIASATAAAQAAWAGLVAYFRRLRCGHGDYIDFSRYEAVLKSLDPPFGSQGQAAAARKGGSRRPVRGRRQDAYPIFACKDGWVRICVLAPRQWRGLRAWLGEPAAFQDPVYDSIGSRFAAFDQIGILVAAHFATQTTSDLLSAGADFGVPIAALAIPLEVLSINHFHEARAFGDLELVPGMTVSVPNGSVVVDGVRAGLRQAAVDGEARWASRHAKELRPADSRTALPRPFEGLRILDLGVIVAGGELGRLFSDLGAEVIKVESPAYPDGLRQTRPGQLVSESFAWTHRNQSSIGLNLRDPAGRQLFGRLVAQSDAILANFKPGTLAALGFSLAQLKAMNPRIVVAESSAYGDRGPWSTRMGYGPLVRASTGITSLWTADEGGPADSQAFCDATTVFPDHVVARIAALAALAVLIRRDRTGAGGRVHVSQAEAAINQLDVVYAAEAARRGKLQIRDDHRMDVLCACNGDDAWCVVSIRDDSDWRTVTSLMASSERAAVSRWLTQQDRWQHRAEIRDALGRWMISQDSHVVAAALQRAGVPAGWMHRASDVLDEPQVVSRRVYATMVHPLLEAPLPTENVAAAFSNIAPAQLGPAPQPGEQTREICRRILALPEDDIEHLIADGVLSEPAVATSTAGSHP